MKKKIRIIIDISMTIMMPMLMAYSLIGELFHEITGSLIFILFIIHHILNRKRGFPGYMFGKTMFAFFDYAEPRFYFSLKITPVLVK